MAMSIHVDVRERGLAAHIPEAKVETLDLGDIQIRSGDLTFVFERKTVADLAASIKDGRYREQKARLLSNVPAHRIAYIIEDGGGSVVGHHGLGVATQAVFRGMFLSTMFRDGIHVIMSTGMEDTAAWVKDLAVRVQKGGDKWVAGGGAACSGEYVNFVKAKKRKIDNIDPSVSFQLQLSQIPGVSTVLARGIVERYPSMCVFVTTLTGLADQAKRLSLLASLPLIGAKKAATILEYLGFTD